jgi:PAS domain S-box-containing protein
MVIETAHRAKNGQLIPVEVSVNYLSYEGKEYHCAFVRDITRRKQAENKLSESEARLQAILDNSPGMVFLKDAEGRYLHVNRQFERAFQMTREQVVGKTDEAIFGPEQAAAFRANDLKVLQAGAPLEFEEAAMHEDGPHTSIVSKFPLYDGDGKSYALCGITTDITERKRAEEALRKSEERYRSIFENAVEGIFQTTLDGKYVAVNLALARMYGYDSPEDMIATITDIASQVYVDPGRRDEFLRLMKEQEELTGFEVLVYRKDGSFIWISECVRAVRDRAGVLVGFEGRVEDITERKLGEERLRSTLEEVRMLSGRLATVQEEERTRIARELHDELGVGLTCLKIDLSRLATIVGDDIGGTARAKLDDKVRSMVEQVDGTIASVQRLVTQLRPALLDDLGLVAAIEWQCQDFQKRTGIPCTCVTSADDIAMEPERARALFRICQEALTNTARHAQATAVTVKLESRNGSLQLTVADNGLGIPDMKVSDRRSLGLIGMRERVALLGGEITIQGHPEKGTIITACLPRCLS